jgi:hypothetical protein
MSGLCFCGQKHIAIVEIQNGIMKVSVYLLCSSSFAFLILDFHFHQIFVDNLNVGAEICSAQIDIFRIKPEAGRVWLGLTASTAKSSSIAHRPGSGFSLYSWSFSGILLFPWNQSKETVMIIFQSGRFWKQSACRECLAPART